MKIRMIASDIDRTLIPKGGRLSDGTRAALKACEDRGIYVVMASGRTFYGARSVSAEIGLHSPVISANGGRADRTPEESVVFEDFIPKELSLRVHDRLVREGCFMTSYVGTRIYMMDETNGFGSKCAQRSEAQKHEKHVIANDPERMLREGTVNPYKYEAYSDDTRLLDELRSEFLSWGLSVSSAFPYNLEILAPGGGKGRALKAISELLGIPREEIMAFGDGSNDRTMLEYAGYGVAVENAVEELKSVAWKVAPKCEDDGVLKILNEYVLSEA